MTIHTACYSHILTSSRKWLLDSRCWSLRFRLPLNMETFIDNILQYPLFSQVSKGDLWCVDVCVDISSPFPLSLTQLYPCYSLIVVHWWPSDLSICFAKAKRLQFLLASTSITNLVASLKKTRQNMACFSPFTVLSHLLSYCNACISTCSVCVCACLRVHTIYSHILTLWRMEHT